MLVLDEPNLEAILYTNDGQRNNEIEIVILYTNDKQGNHEIKIVQV